MCQSYADSLPILSFPVEIKATVKIMPTVQIHLVATLVWFRARTIGCKQHTTRYSRAGGGAPSDCHASPVPYVHRRTVSNLPQNGKGSWFNPSNAANRQCHKRAS